jgi:PEP-CTERM motif
VNLVAHQVSVPEPTSLALVGVGLTVVAYAVRRRRRAT